MAQPISRSSKEETSIFYRHCSDIFTGLGSLRAEIKQNKNAEGLIENSEKVRSLSNQLQNLKALYTHADSASSTLDNAEVFNGARTMSVLEGELQRTEDKLKKAATRVIAPATKSIPAPSATVVAPATKSIPAPAPLENRKIVSFQVGSCDTEVVHHVDTTMDMMLVDIAQLLKTNQFNEAMDIFVQLPPQVQGDIFGEHWKVCGKPTKESREEHLRKMAHDQFGKVSFMGEFAKGFSQDEVKRCHVPHAKRIETLNQYLPLLQIKLAKAKEETQTILQQWISIDQSPIQGSEKCARKKASLDALAQNELLPLFYGRKFQWEAPISAINPSTGRPGESIQAYLAAYAKKYPCFTPF
jgi:hypothetical protein